VRSVACLRRSCGSANGSTSWRRQDQGRPKGQETAAVVRAVSALTPQPHTVTTPSMGRPSFNSCVSGVLLLLFGLTIGSLLIGSKNGPRVAKANVGLLMFVSRPVPESLIRFANFFLDVVELDLLVQVAPRIDSILFDAPMRQKRGEARCKHNAD
jgi:hypothetical protein